MAGKEARFKEWLDKFNLFCRESIKEYAKSRQRGVRSKKRSGQMVWLQNPIHQT